MGDIPVYDVQDAINFISARCNVSKDIIELVLSLDEEYMRSIGIIECDEDDYDEDEEDDNEEEYLEDDEEDDDEFDCHFDIDCEDCGYYIDHEGACPFQTGLFIN